MLDPIAECLTPEVAGRIADARIPQDLQTEIDRLADRCSEGTLTEAERRKYANYVEMIDLISLLQAKARRMAGKRQSP